MNVYVNGVLQGGGGGGDTNATEIQGVPVSPSAPSEGQYLGFSAGSWQPSSFPWVTVFTSAVQTTDATADVPCGALSLPPGSYTLLIVIASETQPAGTGVGWSMFVKVRSDGTTAVIEGNPNVSHPTIFTSWLVKVDAVGATIQLQVTGALATTINWSATWMLR